MEDKIDSIENLKNRLERVKEIIIACVKPEIRESVKSLFLQYDAINYVIEGIMITRMLEPVVIKTDIKSDSDMTEITRQLQEYSTALNDEGGEN